MFSTCTLVGTWPFSSGNVPKFLIHYEKKLWMMVFIYLHSSLEEREIVLFSIFLCIFPLNYIFYFSPTWISRFYFIILEKKDNLTLNLYFSETLCWLRTGSRHLTSVLALFWHCSCRFGSAEFNPVMSIMAWHVSCPLSVWQCRI